MNMSSLNTQSVSIPMLDMSSATCGTSTASSSPVSDAHQQSVNLPHNDSMIEMEEVSGGANGIYRLTVEQLQPADSNDTAQQQHQQTAPIQHNGSSREPLLSVLNMPQQQSIIEHIEHTDPNCLRHRVCPRCAHPMPPPYLHFESFRCEKCSYKCEYHCIRCDSIVVRPENQPVALMYDEPVDEEDPLEDGSSLDAALDYVAVENLMCDRCCTQVGSWSELFYFLFNYDWTEVHQCPQCPAKVDGVKYRCINCHTLMICPEDETPERCVACDVALKGVWQYYVFLHDRHWLSASAWLHAARKRICLAPPAAIMNNNNNNNNSMIGGSNNNINNNNMIGGSNNNISNNNMIGGSNNNNSNPANNTASA